METRPPADQPAPRRPRKSAWMRVALGLTVGLGFAQAGIVGGGVVAIVWLLAEMLDILR